MHRKAQITIFALAGFFVLLFGAFFFYTNKVKESELLSLDRSSFDSYPVKVYVETCLKNTAEDGLLLIGFQGGYYRPSSIHLKYSSFDIPYYHYDRKNFFPGISILEQELAGYVNGNIDSCLKNFGPLKTAGFSIESLEPKSKFIIAPNEVLVEADFPVSLRKDGATAKLERFQAKIDFDLHGIYNLAKGISEQQANNEDYIPIGYLIDLASANKFNFELIYFDNTSVIYSLIFNETNKPYFFNFAVKYSWLSNQSQKLFIGEIPNMKALVGEKFVYYLKNNAKDVAYHAYTDLFKISESGLIEFIPEDKDKGNHLILIKASDRSGNTDTEFMKLKIATENEPPVLSKIPNQIVSAGQLFSYKAIANDKDGDPIFYNIESLLGGLKIGTLSGEIKFTPQPKDIGNHTVKVIVVDIKGSVSEQTFNLEVK
jgi:hypothetical protein